MQCNASGRETRYVSEKAVGCSGITAKSSWRSLSAVVNGAVRKRLHLLGAVKLASVQFPDEVLKGQKKTIKF